MKTLLAHARRRASIPRYRRGLYLLLILLIALIDLAAMGKTSGSLVFYDVRSGKAAVETRAMPFFGTSEHRAARYVEEALLGSESVNLGRLFPKGTRLESLLIRDGVAFVNLSATAAVPAENEVDARRAIATLAAGLERNFRSIKEARVFIAGNEPYAVDLAGTEDFRASSKKTKDVDK